MIRRRKRQGKRGFKRDVALTAARKPPFLNPRSFVSTKGEEVLFGQDMEFRRDEVWKRDGARCMVQSSRYCRGFAGHGDGEADHILSRGMGGSDDLANLRWCCRPCHRKRHVHTRFGEGASQ